MDNDWGFRHICIVSKRLIIHDMLFVIIKGKKCQKHTHANHLLRSTWCLYKIVFLRGLGRPRGECGQAEA